MDIDNPKNGKPVAIRRARPLFRYRMPDGSEQLGMRAALLAEGEVAITRHVAGGPWFITMTASTASLPYEFTTPEAAEAAARQMDKVVSWDRYAEGAAGGIKPNVLAEMTTIAALHGGKLTQRGKLSAKQARRLMKKATRDEPSPV